MLSSPISRKRGALRRLAARAALAAGLAVGALAAHAGEAGRVVFVSGAASVGARALVEGDPIQEGDELKTGADGFIYLRTIDKGLLILRPASRARITAYHIDEQNPANTRVKLELLSGVARSISGQGVKQARQHFRFNTPVAAIGVRGTDFTVFTDQETSRVTVLSGAIVVSGFEGSCGPAGGGPCEHKASRELSAAQAGQMLQVRRGQATPQLLIGGALAPDAAAPPRPDEPLAHSGAAPILSPEIGVDTKKINDIRQPDLPPPAPVFSTNVWGRWAALSDSPATLDTAALAAAGAEALARNGFYAIYRTSGLAPVLPQQGSVGFALRQGDALLHDEVANVVVPARVENGQLNVDFGKATFTTSIDVVKDNERYYLQSKGALAKDGQLSGENQFKSPTNMAVSGALGDNGASAAYIFSSRIDASRVASGVTYWGK